MFLFDLRFIVLKLGQRSYDLEGYHFTTDIGALGSCMEGETQDNKHFARH